MNIDFSSTAAQLTAALCCAALLIFLAGMLLRHGIRRHHAENEPLPYRIRDDFLTDAEFQFYHTLRTYLGHAVTICPKVSLGDLFFAAGENRAGYLNKINRKHVDFLLCDPDSMVPICGVELDDSTHQRPERIERDRFVDGVYEAAGLPLIHADPALGAARQAARQNPIPHKCKVTAARSQKGQVSAPWPENVPHPAFR